ncbi:regulatory protein RecX [Novosphingobium percolationis]|uniref:regulatory protein RecX n=1 Tax=Novosphingobium percolationis TaxID=2871811 RepID=UPI001CD5A872|nr:RecX family transcriptional regulator [Novosphingobium percolationis]MCH7630110.1 RecX family transcriptional regulator [Pseudomonadota bacterium]
MEQQRPDRPGKRAPRPLDAGQLEELALSYVARFATSAGKLADYLKRKLRERGWEGAVAPDVAAVVARMVERRYVDDAVFARAKGQGLLRRGYGARRIGQALGAAGIDEDLRDEGLGSAREQREAVLVLARKRRFGPFGRDGASHDPATREKQVAAMLRAGHPLASARAMVDADTIEEAESWVDEDVD